MFGSFHLRLRKLERKSENELFDLPIRMNLLTKVLYFKNTARLFILEKINTDTYKKNIIIKPIGTYVTSLKI